MNESSETTGSSRQQDDLPTQDRLPEPASRISVAWVAGRRTLHELGPMLKPLAVGLTDEMIDLLLVCPQETDASEMPSPPMELIRHGRLRWVIFPTGAAAGIAAELVSRKVQLLHALDASAGPLTRELARRTSLPHILSSFAQGDRYRLRRLDGRVSAVLAASEPLRENLQAARIVPADRIHLFRPSLHQVREATCFKDPLCSVAIVAGGRMDRFGPFNAVLESFAELRQRKHDCILFLIGSGPAERRLRVQAERLKLRSEVTFVGDEPASQMPSIFKAADMFISPVGMRRIDTWSLLAMASGVPVLAAGVGPSDFIIDGQTAIVLRKVNAATLTSSVVSLLENRSGAKELSGRALAYLRENHSPAKMVATLLDIYRRTIG